MMQKIPVVLSVVKFSSVVAKTVDIKVVDEIVGSPVVAVFPSGTAKLNIRCMLIKLVLIIQAIPIRVTTASSLTPAQLTALTCTRCSPLEFSVKMATVSVVFTRSDMLTEIW